MMQSLASYSLGFSSVVIVYAFYLLIKLEFFKKELHPFSCASM